MLNRFNYYITIITTDPLIVPITFQFYHYDCVIAFCAYSIQRNLNPQPTKRSCFTFPDICLINLLRLELMQFLQAAQGLIKWHTKAEQISNETNFPIT